MLKDTFRDKNTRTETRLLECTYRVHSWTQHLVLSRRSLENTEDEEASLVFAFLSCHSMHQVMDHLNKKILFLSRYDCTPTAERRVSLKSIPTTVVYIHWRKEEVQNHEARQAARVPLKEGKRERTERYVTRQRRLITIVGMQCMTGDVSGVSVFRCMYSCLSLCVYARTLT